MNPDLRRAEEAVIERFLYEVEQGQCVIVEDGCGECVYCADKALADNLRALRASKENLTGALTPRRAEPPSHPGNSSACLPSASESAPIPPAEKPKCGECGGRGYVERGGWGSETAGPCPSCSPAKEEA